MPDSSKKNFFETAFNLDDFQDLSRRKIRRLVSLFLSEFCATGLLVFLLCSTVQAAFLNNAQSHLVIGLTAGFAVATAVMIFGHVSGSLINPALSLSAVILGHMSIPMMVYYTVAECLGATFGYSLTRAILPSTAISEEKKSQYAGQCCSVPTSGLQDSEVLLAEFIGTSLLSWAFCSAMDKVNLNKHDSLPVKFGIVIIALALPLGLYSGCSINPARSFGPALYNQYWTKHWIYWIGPLGGSLFSAVSYRLFFDSSCVDITTNSKRDPATINLKNNSHKCEEEA